MATTTLETPVIKPSEEIEKLIDKARIKLNFGSADELSINLSGLAANADSFMREMIATKPSSRKALFKQKRQEIKKTLEEQYEYTKKTIPDKIAQIAMDQLFNLLNAANALLIAPFDEPIIFVLTTYNKIIRISRLLFSKDLKEERKTALRNEWNEQLKNAMGVFPEIADIIALIIMIDTLKSTIKTFSNAKDASEEQYEDVINKAKAAEELLNQEYLLTSVLITTILYILSILTPLLALIGAAFNSAKEFDKETRKKISEAQNNDNSLPVSIDPAKTTNSQIVKYAKENINGYSYSYIENTQAEVPNDSALPNKPSNNNKDDICHEDNGIDYMNMCIVDRSGKLSEKEMDAYSYGPTREIIEIDKTNSNYTLFVNEKQEFQAGDKIAEIDGISIIPEFGGEIEKIEKNIIFVKDKEKSTDELIDSINSLANSETNNIKTKLQSIIDDFSDLSEAENVIREYIPYTVIPKVPLNISVDTKNAKKTKDNILKQYERHVDALIDKHKEKIQELSGKDHVTALANQEKLNELKDEILNEKEAFFKNIFHAWEFYLTENNMNCKTDEKQFYLLGKYLDLYSKIDYDEDKKYEYELLNILTDFISTRSIIESSNVKEAISSLNDLCDSVLRQKWAEKQSYIKQLYAAVTPIKNMNSYNYYIEFEKMFKTNYYTQLNTSDTHPSLNSEYKKMYDFLVSIMDANDDTEQPVTEMNTDDINSILNGGGKDESKKYDTTKAKIRSQIKEICNRYTIIKNIKDYNHYHEGGEIRDVNTLEFLTKQTKYEYEILEKFYLKLKTIYFSKKSLYDNKTYEEFKQAQFIKKPDVYYNNIRYKHYFVTNDSSSEKPKYDDKNAQKFNNICQYASSPYTSITIDDYRYWLKYCTYATIVGCALPFYWPCGLIIAGAPIPLPVIYVPIYFLSGGFSMLFGLGICGIAVWPMIVCLNFTVDTKCIIQPVNFILDAIKQQGDIIKNLSMNKLNDSLKLKLDNLKEKNTDFDNEIRDLEIQIKDKKEEITGNGIIKRQVENARKKKKEKEQKKKNQEN